MKRINTNEPIMKRNNTNEPIMKRNNTNVPIKKKNISLNLNIVLIGNPGGGKSTILNALTGEINFKSGVSFGHGLTTVCQRHVDKKNDIVYIDTPGLADIESRKKAAQEITLALKSCGHFRIFFVITLEEGRIRPDDMTTMKLVLDAAPIGCNYSIIVNKLHPIVIEKLLEGDNRKKLETCLNHKLPGTSSIYYNENVKKLSSQENVLHQLPTALAQFIASSPVIKILPDEVKDVKDENYEEVIDLLTEELGILRRSIEVTNKELIENQKKK